MSKNQPDKVQLTIASEERLSPDMLGIDLRVKVLDQAKQPINGQPFKVHVDGEVLVQGATDENGEYNGQRVLTVREGTQRKVFLVLEGSAATDWKVIGNQKKDEQQPPSESDYVFGARMQGFTTTVKLQSHNLQIDENAFLKVLAGSISLSVREKFQIINAIWKEPQSVVDRLIATLSDEFTRHQELSRTNPKYHQQLKDLEDKAEADWRALERFFG